MDPEAVKELWMEHRKFAMMAFRTRPYLTVPETPRLLAPLESLADEVDIIKQVTFIYETKDDPKEAVRRWRVRSDNPPMVLEMGTEHLG